MLRKIETAIKSTLRVHGRAIKRAEKMLDEASPLELQKYCSAVLSLANATGHLSRARMYILDHAQDDNPDRPSEALNSDRIHEAIRMLERDEEADENDPEDEDEP